MCEIIRQSVCREIRGLTCVELGTGWHANSSMVLLSLGAECVHSFDLYRHLNQQFWEAGLEEIRNIGHHSHHSHHTEHIFPFDCDLVAAAGRMDVNAIDLAQFHYQAPHDAQDTGLDSDSADLYFSHAVLEHCREHAIVDLLRESHRVLRSGGLCWHYVQPTMHAAWKDPGATGIEYLTCSDRLWRILYENDIAHENRLRGVQYVELIRASGFEILGSWHKIDSAGLAVLSHRTLAPRYRHFTPEELATNHIWILSRKV